MEHYTHLRDDTIKLIDSSLLGLPYGFAKATVVTVSTIGTPTILLLCYWKASPFNGSTPLVLLAGALAFFLGITSFRRTLRISLSATGAHALLLLAALLIVLAYVQLIAKPPFVDGRGHEWKRLYRDVDLSQTDLSGQLIDGTKVLQSNLTNSNLSRARLVAANLANSRLDFADLTDADLSNSLLSATTFLQANFARTRLQRTFIEDTDLSVAINLSQSQIDSACIGHNVKLPPGLTAPATRWAECNKKMFPAE